MTDFIPPAKPIIGDEERAAVDRVLRSGMLAQGPEVKAFEEEFAEHFGLGRACVAVNSGTSGLHLGLLACGVGAGDEVIVPSFTFAATANSVALTGATPVFADIDADDFCLVARGVRGRDHRAHRRRHAGAPLRPPGRDGRDHPDRRRTAACRCSRTPPRRTVRRCTARPVGAFGSFAMFSLYPTKNMTSGEGGMVSVATDEVERLMRLYRNQGMERQYDNEVVGFNTRMTDIHAAIGRVQLTKVGGWTAQRQHNAAFLDANLTGVDHAAGRRRRGARLPPVHDPRPRRPRRVRGGAARGARRRLGHVLPRSPTTGCCRSGRRRPAGDRAGRRGVPLAARAPLAEPGRPRARSSPPSTPSPGRVPDGEPAGRASSGSG